MGVLSSTRYSTPPGKRLVCLILFHFKSHVIRMLIKWHGVTSLNPVFTFTTVPQGTNTHVTRIPIYICIYWTVFSSRLMVASVKALPVVQSYPVANFQKRWHPHRCSSGTIVHKTPPIVHKTWRITSSWWVSFQWACFCLSYCLLYVSNGYTIDTCK